MPWTKLSTVSLPQGDPDVYKFLFFPAPLTGLQWAVSIENVGQTLLARTRVGFYYPVLAVQGKILYGASAEIAGSDTEGTTALHNISYAFISSGTLAAQANEVHGVAVAPSRGVLDASAALWRFT